MSLEEKFESLMKQNEFLANQVREDSQRNRESQAQNEYLRKQLGSFLKQKQRINEEIDETRQSEPRVREQVQSHDVDSSSEEEEPRMMLILQVKKKSLEGTEECHETSPIAMTSEWSFLSSKVN